MKQLKKVNLEEKLFLETYKKKSLHYFREILTYCLIITKLTNK
ncbi:hypothetical protein STRMA_1530 [Streptococcus macacae NCTC 11558]|uniref:Uncharacterized protein n=1 Tax=Streptococcus macacae NCTC 11558 TaxID=764298 RepID=G5JWY7_9STRE|nr:hypothetical protein STRMA_1530 [Streptococcus macacae NCTC 11558]